MALTDEGTNTTMLVQPSGFMGNYGGGFGNLGGDWAWILLLLLIGGNGCGFGGWGMGGYGGMMYEFPWLLNGQNMINANTNSGFDHAATQSAIAGLQNSVTSGFGDVATQLCGGFAGVNASIANGFAQAEIANNARQIADLERSFAAQTASTQGINAIQGQLAQCCCDNRAGLADLRYTVATEACADRAAINDALRDVIAANTASTQKILDQMCKDKIDAKNDEIAQLRQQLNMADLRASQTAQNAFISQGFSNEVDALYNRLNSCPVPTTPVYGRTPIFTCNSGCGCGCGMAA